MAKVWFGNINQAQYVEAPESGMDADYVGVSERLDFQNGGAYVTMSEGTHREFNMAWGIKNKSLLNFLPQYRNGAFGSGLLYWVDPFATNVFPPHFARPELTTKGWPSLVGAGVPATLVRTTALRTNLIHNPSFETGVTTWTVGANTSFAVSTAQKQFGSQSGLITRLNTTAGNGYILRTVTGLTVGNTYTFSFYVYGGTGNYAYKIGSTSNVTFAAPGATWTRISRTFVAATTSTQFYINDDTNTTPTAGTTLYVDGVMLEESPTLNPYFDGDTRYMDGTAASWTGAAHVTPSTVPLSVNEMPSYGAQYTVNPTTPVVREHVLLIPNDKELAFGITGSATDGAVVRMQRIGLDGSLAPVQDISLLSVAGTTRVNTIVSGAAYKAVRLYITTTGAGPGTITLYSAHAQYKAIGATVTYPTTHLPGEGHSGLRFEGGVTMPYVQAVNGRTYVTAAAKFTEVGAWL